MLAAVLSMIVIATLSVVVDVAWASITGSASHTLIVALMLMVLVMLVIATVVVVMAVVVPMVLVVLRVARPPTGVVTAVAAGSGVLTPLRMI